MSHIADKNKKIKIDSLCKSEAELVLKLNKKRKELGEASSSISLQKKKTGSVTVEAALVLPLFLWFILMLFYFFFLIDIQGDISMATAKTAKELGQYQYCKEDYLKCFSSQYISRSIIEELEEARLNKSCIKNGTKGIECKLRKESLNKVDIVIKYDLKIPVPIFSLLEYPVVQRTFVHGWTGFDDQELHNAQEKMVYITEEGSVYHQYRSCTYLDLSIRAVEINHIPNLRNRSGEKYQLCEKCGKKHKNNIVYITGWGNRYHASLSCSGLKRTVYTIPISQIGHRRRCSKCW